ncbi:regulator of G-protein signaling [Fusarium solani]|uniref:Regulator of G-protein signaling n=1 Tax=Fusarium solani TaxID=169388 RepID=A0A9P9H0I2_FUSSL|nr:regulator of G-protein signaling [Fusarium solani]KAH7248252.1 regulator of G-protein signaling [Fusarium solani]
METTDLRHPTLSEILLDISPSPWTLRAFMAHLSQHHCEETLEFTWDAENYDFVFNQLAAESPMQRDRTDRVISSWQKLIQIYIAPGGPRQVNISSRERDHLLNLPCGPPPPHPSELDESRRIIYNLMNDSILVPFLKLVSPMQHESPLEERIPSPDIHPQPSVGWDAAQSVSSRNARESEGSVDNGNKNSPLSNSALHISPGGFHHVIAACKRYWERVRRYATLHP